MAGRDRDAGAAERARARPRVLSLRRRPARARRRQPNDVNTFVFDNDYAALPPGGGDAINNKSGLLVAQAESGVCRVVCFTPRHDLTMARVTNHEVERVVEVWIEQYRALGDIETIGSGRSFKTAAR